MKQTPVKHASAKAHDEGSIHFQSADRGPGNIGQSKDSAEIRAPAKMLVPPLSTWVKQHCLSPGH
jgi:hypothetical protein